MTLVDVEGRKRLGSRKLRRSQSDTISLHQLQLPGEAAAGESEKEPAPPVRLGGLIDEVYHKVGNANDIIAIKRRDGQLCVYDFSVHFGRKVRAGGGAAGAPSVLTTAKRAVHIYVNGKLQPQLYMRVQDDGFCAFPDGSLRPRPEALKSGLGLVPGVNNVRFEIRFLRDARVLVAECFAFLWSLDTPVIVMDIDGTITRSDVPGLLMTLSPGIYDHTHSGICSLLKRVVDEGAQVLYLTSRPILLATKTRSFLVCLKQGDVRLPLGPLQCSREKVERVIWREVFSKNMHEFKISILQGVVFLFRDAGKTFGDPVFAAGIGNKFTDAMAYRAAGVPRESIFLIDSSSNVQVWDGDTSRAGGSEEGQAIPPMQDSDRSTRKRLGIRKRLFGAPGAPTPYFTISGPVSSTGSGPATEFEPEISVASCHAALPDITPAMHHASAAGAGAGAVDGRRVKSHPLVIPKTKLGSSRHLPGRSRSMSAGAPRQKDSDSMSSWSSSQWSRGEAGEPRSGDESSVKSPSRWRMVAAAVTRQDSGCGYEGYSDVRFSSRMLESLRLVRQQSSKGAGAGAGAGGWASSPQGPSEKRDKEPSDVGSRSAFPLFSAVTSGDHGAGVARDSEVFLEKRSAKALDAGVPPVKGLKQKAAAAGVSQEPPGDYMKGKAKGLDE